MNRNLKGVDLAVFGGSAVLIATFTNLTSPVFQNTFKGDTFVAVEAYPA